MGACVKDYALKKTSRIMPEYFPQDVVGYHIDIVPRGRFRPALKRLGLEPWYIVGSRISLTFVLQN